jgi:hypothetical protein
MRLLRLGAALASASPLLLLGSCGVDALDLAGKQCPCTAAYVCDVASNTCVTSLSREGGVVEGGGGGDAAPDAAPGALLGVQLVATADWKTPSMVRWELAVTGQASDFKAYTLETGKAPADFAAQAVSTFGPLERPELGMFDARGKKTTGPVTVWTLVPAKPNAKQYARATVTDRSDRASVSEIVAFDVPATLATRAKIFDGLTAATTPRPAGEFDFKGAMNGHVFVTDCGAAASPCAKKVELGNLALALDAGGPFSDADFTRALLEIGVEGNVAVSSFDTGVAIEPGDGSCTGIECRYRYGGWTQSAAPNAGEATLQIPLAKLVNGQGAPLTRAILQAKGDAIAVLAISGTWKQGTTLKLRSAFIRW